MSESCISLLPRGVANLTPPREIAIRTETLALLFA
jgi:hypothetical protein